MKDRYLSAMGKQFLCALTLGSGVVLLSIPSVADAGPASSALKVISGICKAGAKTKRVNIKAPTQAVGPVTRSGGNSINFPPGATYVTLKVIERQRREQEKK